MTWLTDIGKELVVAILTAGGSWIAHLVCRLHKDLNSNFDKIRSLEHRVKELEDETWGDQDGR